MAAIKQSFLSSKTKTIPANRSIIVDAEGAFFLCKESAAMFQMQMDNGEKFDMEAGLSFNLLPGDAFKRLTFFNSSATDNEISFYTGQALVKDSRFNNLLERSIVIQVISAPTRPVATEDSLGAGLTIAAGASATIPGTNTGQTRVELTVTNMSEDDDLYILDSAGEWLSTVFPRSAWTRDLSFTVKLKVPSTASAAVICTVLEQYPL